MALRLIGVGFGRTGTLSLKVALEKLGLSRALRCGCSWPRRAAGALYLAEPESSPDLEESLRALGYAD